MLVSGHAPAGWRAAAPNHIPGGSWNVGWGLAMQESGGGPHPCGGTCYVRGGSVAHNPTLGEPTGVPLAFCGAVFTGLCALHKPPNTL